jgi:predicted transcriptional regulator
MVGEGGVTRERIVADIVGLTGLQLSIMEVLWQRREATAQATWRVVSRERPLALTTVATILSRLERKGVVTHRREGRQHVYSAVVSRAEVRRSKVRDLTERLFDGDAAALMSHLVRAEDVDPEELARIRELLDEAGSGARGQGA